MRAPVTTVAVLGSTGSIGRSTLDVIRASEGRLRATTLAAHRSVEILAQQAWLMRPDRVVIACQEAAATIERDLFPPETEILAGEAGILAAATAADTDTIVSAIVGSAGLRGTWAALEAGKVVALANKETLVVAGPLIIDLLEAQASGRPRLLPIDSEHSAIFQALHAGRKADVKRIILTASGGPFRQHTPEQLAEVTIEEALNHPTWQMGPKISVDSATMMNKALEIIEARWLFDLRADQIDVVIHPQSVVHSMVEYIDGSIVAQLSPPDMRLPIQYALTYPERWPSPAE
ncbi:MAG TPA: 1-deoxy-D-xylulose-5-phosphate reductoisomerase, partial [Pirellulales bacterium]|nr:1-deoxy-D-xylulose-5-phosphate reductoisomerase [Pirellulales bacterium]